MVLIPTLFVLLGVANRAFRDIGIPPDGWRVEISSDSLCEVKWRPPSKGLRDSLLYRVLASPYLRWFAALVLLAPPLLVDTINRFRFIDTPNRLIVNWVFLACWILVMSLLFRWNELTRARCARIRLEGFPEESLSLVRPSSARKSADRFHLVFNAGSLGETQFIGFPGVSESSGKAIREEINRALAKQAAGEGERTKRCSGLAIKSGGVDDPLVASR
jgi:hypothetical protein